MVTTHETNSSTNDSSAIPLSFPALVRNPGLTDRFAHLQDSETLGAVRKAAKQHRRNENDGKRWVRRKENDRFAGNSYIVTPSRQDYHIQAPQIRNTFPIPLPPYLHRTAKVPTSNAPRRDPASANAGRFTTSLKGVRRELRRSGYLVQVLVNQVEREVLDWLSGGVMFDPDNSGSPQMSFPGKPIGDLTNITEVSRTPLQMIWRIPDDARARFIVHLTARYHEVVSFSKETTTAYGIQRLTYLLRPNVVKPDFKAAAAFDTPPITDIDYSSQLDESDFMSDVTDTHSELGDSESEARGRQPLPPLQMMVSRTLPSISESKHDVPLHSRSRSMSSEWSAVGGSDIDGDESASDLEDYMADSIDSLSILTGEQKSEFSEGYTDSSFVSQLNNGLGAPSSPSRSPARCPTKGLPHKRGVQSKATRFEPPKSRPARLFYEYVFS